MKTKKIVVNSILTLGTLSLSFGLTFLFLGNEQSIEPSLTISNKNAFSKPLSDLSTDQNRRFILGKNLFHGTSNDSRSLESRGIGPLYNALTCGECHGGGGISNPDSSPSLSVKLFNQNSPNKMDPNYGTQIQTSSTTNYFDEAKVIQLKNGKFKLDELHFGEIKKDTITYSRIAQKVIGQGLVEAIPDQFFYDKADPNDENRDGISGKIAFSKDSVTGQETIARFGAKATEPNVRSQTLKAAFEDIGLSNSQLGIMPCTEPLNCTLEPEMTNEQEDFLVFYTRSIAPPKSRKLNKQTKTGKQVFNSIGCSSCHTGSIKIRRTDVVKNDNVYIHPMSDFLLHSMGDNLADDASIEGRDADEFRTAPLWGIGLVQTVNGSLNLLHDGRAKTINQAILFHGGEAKISRNRYAKLSPQDKKSIVAYLNTL